MAVSAAAAASAEKRKQAKPAAAPSGPTAEWQLPATLAKRYEPLGRLGAGGMGSVVKARNRLLPEQQVAIKRPLKDAAPDVRAELAARIAGEAKGLARLSGNANVARVYDLAEIDNELFLVMELVEGVSMDKLVHKRNPLGNAPIGAVGLQSLDALAAAHGESILHRDIKPSNFMLTPRGRVVLLDFGLAAFGVRPNASNDETSESIQGSPFYLAPEVWLGRTADVRSDIWSLGVTLYELCTGVNPFRRKATSMEEVLNWTTTFTPPPATEVNRKLHRALGEVIARALEKDPKDRPQTAREMTRLWEDAVVEAGLVPEELRVRPDGTGPECLFMANVLAGDEEDESATMMRTRYSGSYRGSGGGMMRWLMFAVLAGGASAGAFLVGKGQSADELAKARSDASELPRLMEADTQQRGKIADLEKRLADAEARCDARGTDQATAVRDLAAQKAQYAELKGKYDAEAKRLAAAEMQVAAAGEAIKAAKEACTKADLEAARLNERNKGLETELKRATEQSRTLAERLAALEKAPPKPPAVPLKCPADAEAAKAAQQAWADPLTRQATFENSVGVKLALVPPGSFDMGSPETEEGRDTDEKLHRVTLTKPYYLGAFEVTNAQFRKFRPAHDSGKTAGTTPDGKPAEKTLNDDSQPVVVVSYADAVAYCEWLSNLPEEKKAGRKYRLPSEAEWEYACRAGAKTRFWWGNGVDVTRINFSDRNSPEKNREESLDDGFAVTAPVGSLPPNPWGLCEMHGNAWEWCADRYDAYPDKEVADPLVVKSPKNEFVVRGGSWASKPLLLRAACRNPLDARYKSGEIGFRVLCEAPPAAK